jgi:hypothetical protein
MFRSLSAAYRKTLRSNDAVCFISSREDQLVFIYRFKKIGTRRKNKTSVPFGILTSVRLRMPGRRWNPLMLANYASDVGLELEGLPLFEEYFAELEEAA